MRDLTRPDWVGGLDHERNGHTLEQIIHKLKRLAAEQIGVQLP